MSQQEGWHPRCTICNQAVDLNESKADQDGHAVHEDCYVAALSAEKQSQAAVEILVLPEKFSVWCVA